MNINELEQLINDYKSTDTYLNIINSKRYYNGDHDIKQRKILDNEGNELDFQANNKLCHPFINKIINQEISFLLGKDFVISSDDLQCNEILQDVFTEQLRESIVTITQEGRVCGLAFMQVYLNESGDLNFKVIPSEQILPIWEENNKRELKAVIRFYSLFKNQISIPVMEYYTSDDVIFYMQDGNKWIKTPNLGHFLAKEDNTEYKGFWGKVPFIVIDFYNNEKTLFELLKPLIDNYDIVRSDMANILQDTTNSIMVIENFGGMDGESIARARSKIMKDRLIGTLENGKVYTIDTKMDNTTAEKHIAFLRQDIYDFACAVDMQKTQVGNQSGQALKFIFSDLDTKTNLISKKLEMAINNMLWFVHQDSILNNRSDFDYLNYSITWNKDIIINEMEAIDMCAKSRGLISEYTLLENHPFVKNTQEEINRIKDEEQQTAINEANLYNFPLGGQ